MHDLIRQISLIGIVPVVKLDDEKDALPLAKALIEGELPCAEVTFRTAQAKESIRLIAESYPDMLMGAGTVLTTGQVDEALEAGAKFIVSPGFNSKIVKYCLEKEIPVIPGCSNPSDIEQALELGLDVVKFFPAEAAGGLKSIKAMAAPYGAVKFMPTGGINPKNINDYLGFDRVIACGGSWMVSEALIKEGRFDEITALSKQAVAQVLGFEPIHVGINANGDKQAEVVADSFAGLFGFEKKVTSASVFAGTGIEIMKNAGFGTNGHLAISTNSVCRAVAYLKGKGCGFNERSARYDADGNLYFIYLSQEIGGFAVHLIQKGY
jgi:Entner-Doudoroff aldolase